MSIYSSEQVHPYVYKCTHKITGQIYIGSRTAKDLKLPSHLDLPKYKTSSKYVKPIFHEFDWIIVAEFFDPEDAYNHEQLLIWEQWQVSKTNSMNRTHHHGKKSFNKIGTTHSEETLKKMSKPRKPKTEEVKERMRLLYSLRGPVSEETRAKLRKANSLKGPVTEETREKIKKAWLLRDPMTDETRNKIMKSKTKLYDFLTPYGFLIEQISIRNLCENFNLDFNGASVYFSKNNRYKSFIRIISKPHNM